MKTLMDACHRIAMTDDVKSEWDRHASRWSQNWYASMVRKGKVRFVVPDDCGDIQEAIENADVGHMAREAMKKDLHLVAAALRASMTVVTRDGRCAAFYTELAAGVPRLNDLIWIDPQSGELPPHRH
ncbi:MAG: hypothetical protein U0R50_17660 [Gaiellales bacterium]